MEVRVYETIAGMVTNILLTENINIGDIRNYVLDRFIPETETDMEEIKHIA